MVRVASVLCVAIVFQAVCGYPRRNYARLDEGMNVLIRLNQMSPRFHCRFTVKPDLDDVRLTRSAEESPHSGTHAEGTSKLFHTHNYLFMGCS